MAIAYVENPVTINNYHDITIYHVHKGDLAENPVRENIYTLNPYGSENDEMSFDIRDIEGYDEDATNAANLVRMIDNDAFDEMLKAFDEDAYLTRTTSLDSIDDMRDETESDEHRCPICGCNKDQINFDDDEIIDNQLSFEFACENCGAMGKQFYTLRFAGYEVK